MVWHDNRVTASGLKAILAEAKRSREGVMTAFSTDIDGSVDSLPGLGTFAALGPMAKRGDVLPGPTIVASRMG